jgi:hypothetical protein
VSPYEKLFGRKLSITKFRPFGCLAHMFLHEIKRKKLDRKSIPRVLQETIEHGNYRVYDLEARKGHVSRHIIFSETVFPACNTNVTTAERTASSEESNSNVDNSASFETTDNDRESVVSEAFTEDEYEEGGELNEDGLRGL